MAPTATDIPLPRGNERRQIPDALTEAALESHSERLVILIARALQDADWEWARRLAWNC